MPVSHIESIFPCRQWLHENPYVRKYWLKSFRLSVPICILFANQYRMKTTLLSFVCCLLIVTTATSSTVPQANSVQSTEVEFNNNFVRFNAHKQGQAGIALTWIFSDPGNVVSFVVERSYDGSYFERVAELPAADRNQFRDGGVYPGYIYYRIIALMYDGSAIYSNVEIVRIVRNG